MALTTKGKFEFLRTNDKGEPIAHRIEKFKSQEEEVIEIEQKPNSEKNALRSMNKTHRNLRSEDF